MGTNLDMSLDDLIKSSRSNSERGRGRGRGQGRGRGRGRGGTFSRGRGAGMLRRGPLGVNTRPSAFSIAKSFSRAKDLIWRHDLFDDSMVAAGLSGIEPGTKLYISNLDQGVTNEDIKELFSEVGEIKRYAVHYDRSGRSSGSAEVVFVSQRDALAAMKRYNNIQLDGKRMKIEVIGTNVAVPTARVNVIGRANGRGRRTVVMTPNMGRGAAGSTSLSWAPSRRGRGAFRRGNRGRGRGRGRGQGRKQLVEKSADDLDKDLDNYHAEAMNTS